MNRRVRTGPIELNGHGCYVCYLTYWEAGAVRFMALCITAGPSAGMWRFDYE